MSNTVDPIDAAIAKFQAEERAAAELQQKLAEMAGWVVNDLRHRILAIIQSETPKLQPLGLRFRAGGSFAEEGVVGAWSVVQCWRERWGGVPVQAPEIRFTLRPDASAAVSLTSSQNEYRPITSEVSEQDLRALVADLILAGLRET